MIKRRTLTAVVLGLLALAAIVPIPLSRALNAPAQPDAASADNTLSCQEILQRAMDAVQSSCDDLGRNKACYGNALVKIQPKDATASLKFDAVGDKVSIQDVQKLITMPLNRQAGTWGLSLLKLQANLPDTNPGQNVTFLVYGDTSVENVSGDMQAFYFSSTLGTPSCKELPRDAILVRSPNHVQVSFQANGVDITIASTIVMQAVRKQSMSVTLIEGHAHVATSQGAQDLLPGQVVTVPLGGANGLDAVGAPSKPVAAPKNAPINSLLNMTDKVADPDLGATPAATMDADGTNPDFGATPAATMDADGTNPDQANVAATPPDGGGKPVKTVTPPGKIVSATSQAKPSPSGGSGNTNSGGGSGNSGGGGSGNSGGGGSGGGNSGGSSGGGGSKGGGGGKK